MSEYEASGGSAGDGDGRAKRGRGRPRKSGPVSTGSAFDVIAGKRIPYVVDGKTELLTLAEAIDQQLFMAAWSGKTSATVEVLKWIQENQSARSPRHHAPPVVKIEHRPARIDDVLILLGIATETYIPQKWEDNTPRLQLEPGVVAYTLKHHQPQSISASALDGIRKRTRNPDVIDWPELSES